MIPHTVTSPDDLHLTVPADGPFYPGSGFLQQRLRSLSLSGGVLSRIGHGRRGIGRENLIDHFDRVSVLQRFQRIGDPVYPHTR